MRIVCPHNNRLSFFRVNCAIALPNIAFLRQIDEEADTHHSCNGSHFLRQFGWIRNLPKARIEDKVAVVSNYWPCFGCSMCPHTSNSEDISPQINTTLCEVEHHEDTNLLPVAELPTGSLISPRASAGSGDRPSESPA